MGVVLSKFFLRINISQHLGCLPPFWACLDHDGVWLDILNEFLGSLSEHGRHVAATNQENFFAIVSLSKMNKCTLKAVDSIFKNIITSNIYK